MFPVFLAGLAGSDWCIAVGAILIVVLILLDISDDTAHFHSCFSVMFPVFLAGLAGSERAIIGGLQVTVAANTLYAPPYF
ncbi:unnamed protein product [Haemonchus placei]|uniref:CitMHS domain-containing protein n=1 Tax=Haemonchus placei TaxID=6290 RepID=A0A0N4WJR2_HAEPC|nr:unnamed protein product [Haemonchus placei]